MEEYRGIKAKCEFSKKDKAFIDYCVNHGYEIIECKAYNTKTKYKFKITDTIIIEWQLLHDTIPFAESMLSDYINLTLEVEGLREQKRKAEKQ